MLKIGDQFCQRHDHEGVFPKIHIERLAIKEDDVKVDGTRSVLICVADPPKFRFDLADNLLL